MSKFKHNLELPMGMSPTAPEAKEQLLRAYIDVVDAIARTTYKSLYIIDYSTMGFAYVSDNPLFLCGLTPKEVLEKGYDYYYDFLYKEDLNFLFLINRVGFKFLAETAVEDRLRYTISYSFYIPTDASEASTRILVNHQLTPLCLDKDGNIWLALCAVSLAHSQEPYSAFITMEGSQTRWQYSHEYGIWKELPKLFLTDKERAIIVLSRQGMTTQEIADTIHRSIDTVKGYRKELFRKLGVESISEAIASAIHHRLI